MQVALSVTTQPMMTLGNPADMLMREIPPGRTSLKPMSLQAFSLFGESANLRKKFVEG
jgi:hypothetical protein